MVVFDSKCCLRLLSAIKACVSRGSGLRQSAVERVTSELRDTVNEVAADRDGEQDPAVVGGPAVQVTVHADPQPGSYARWTPVSAGSRCM